MSIILGFSGLSGVRPFKRRYWPDLDESEYSIAQGADAAAALVVDGELAGAVAEERFDEIKHSAAFPGGAIDWCLRQRDLEPSDVDYLAHSFCFLPERDFYVSQSPYYRGLYDEALAPEVIRNVAGLHMNLDLSERFVAVPHHLAHAESAFAPSGFSEALVVVSDGLAERYSTTVFKAGTEGLQTIATIPASSSLGLLYGLFTLYLGFEFGDGEQKVMGLAPYGDRNRYGQLILDRWLHLKHDGRYYVSLLLENGEDLDKETYRAALLAMERELGPRRVRDAPVEQRHMDTAAGLQAAIEAAQLNMYRYFQQETGMYRLCLAGGVALNCTANGVALRSRLFSDIFVQPASGDDGAALGAALHVARTTGATLKIPRGSSFGPGYDDAAYEAATRHLPKQSIETFRDDAELVRTVSRRICDGDVVALFQGRMEFGPRALGNRSILADPRRGDARERINNLVKKRESFRPFAPAVPAERAPDLFEIASRDVDAFENMLFVAYVRPEFRAALPAVTHVDGTARVQVVRRETVPLFWELLEEFGRVTGLPVLLNTSFNVAGQPIVRAPEQAVQTFLDAGLDALVLGRKLISRPGQASRPRSLSIC